MSDDIVQTNTRYERLPLFPLGRIVSTPGAEDALFTAKETYPGLLKRHVTGDWGDLTDDDKAENDFAIDKYLRIFSAYILSNGEKVWVITEADRSVTTFLTPDEY